ncbi:carbohydrate-binding protein [Saccharothrix sp. S26]|uniref:carbohydrate-binding protein n=1 Tax=Saccharothrix sp. S26 TaxID=2907215 RepID=UPI001F3BD28C|nr:carbohydrate-binding protein [Saccharothrix sp. S26]MCE6996390.1 carbohydrate-binding protein [Saccharothrix sp. S26]
MPSSPLPPVVPRRSRLRRAAIALLAAGALLAPAVPAAAVAADQPGRVTRPGKVTPPTPDSPISGKSVPALRGEAAKAAAGAKLGEQVLKRGEDFKAAQTRRQASSSVPLPPWSGSLHTVWGAFPTVVSDGAQATHTINPGISIPSGNPDVVYAPTLVPSGKTCIEVTTFYWQGGNGVGAWDWCAASPGFAAVAWINSSFLSTYTTTFQGLPAYTVLDVQTNAVTNSWTAYLYNYTTSTWDALFTSADTSKLVDPHGGWSMFEVYTDYNPATGEGYYCTETYGTQFHAANLQIKVNGTWTPLTPGNSSVTPPGSVSSADFGCYGLSFTLQTANSHWQVSH